MLPGTSHLDQRVIQSSMDELNKNLVVLAKIMADKNTPLAGLSFAEQLVRIRNGFFDIYTRVAVDLSIARTNEIVELAGAGITARSSTNDPDAELSVRLNRADMPLIPLAMQTRLSSPFARFYITNTAQSGKSLDLFIVKEPSLFEYIESPSLDAALLAELQGSTTGTDFTASVTTDAQARAANDDRKSILIFADPTNTVDLMVGDSSAVAAGAAAFARLSPGQSWSADDYRGAVYVEAADAATATRYYGFEVGV